MTFGSKQTHKVLVPEPPVAVGVHLLRVLAKLFDRDAVAFDLRYTSQVCVVVF